MSSSLLLDVTCPEGVAEGDIIAVEHEGTSFEVPLPPGVEPGAVFQVTLPDESQAPSGLDAIAAGMAVTRNAVATARGRTARPIEANEVLAEALRRILLELEHVEALDRFIDTHAGKFEGWSAAGEQPLELGSLHAEYRVLVESGIAAALQRLGCTAEEVFAAAAAHSASRLLARSEEVERRLARLLAMSDYAAFCRMMSDVAQCGGMGV